MAPDLLAGTAPVLMHGPHDLLLRLSSLCAACTIAAVHPALAQVDWLQRTREGSQDAAMAYDVQRGRLILIGGSHPILFGLGGTWEWTGSGWTLVPTSTSSPAIARRPMATFAARAEVVLSPWATSTSIWDGIAWQQRVTVANPGQRELTAMCEDSWRNHVVMFGGSVAAALLADTWEWNGADWTAMAPAASPPAREGHGLAFDPVRRRSVLFGGLGASGALADLWEWDGIAWTQRNPAHSPPARQRHGMAWDDLHAQLVMFGGASASASALDDTWLWDGQDWSVVAPANRPSTRSGLLMAYDRSRARTVMHAGVGAQGILEDTWEWDGSNWTLQSPGPPTPRSASAMTWSAANAATLLFGGVGNGPAFPLSGDTWLWDGDRWSTRAVLTSPPARYSSAMSYDTGRGMAVLFGGWTTAGAAGDTWQWNGTAWTQAVSAAAPPARAGHTMTYDAAQGRIVLFGGGASATLFGDTWSFDGTNWLQHQPATSPPPRTGAAMAHDLQRANTILFGGTGTPTILGDCWMWNGSTWLQLTPPTLPPARYNHAMVYDQARSRLVVFGGDYPLRNDAWDWDGVTWTQIATPTSPLNRSGHAMSYDPLRREIVLFGGWFSGSKNDTWTLGIDGESTTFGAGCAGSLGVPVLQVATTAQPLPGGTAVVDVANLPLGLALMAMGFSDMTSGGIALPRALAPFGMPGCSLLVDPAASVLFGSTTNTARWQLAIPGSARLFGVELFVQAFPLDFAANVRGVTVSNGGRFRIGH